jgi:hypothetical protein
MSHFGRGSVGWWEVMRSECVGHFRSERGQRLVRCGASERAHTAVRGGAGQAGPAGRPRPSGEGDIGPVGEEGGWPRLG